jgi:membrane protein DedA with SNARE-associated domain
LLLLLFGKELENCLPHRLFGLALKKMAVWTSGRYAAFRPFDLFTNLFGVGSSCDATIRRPARWSSGLDSPQPNWAPSCCSHEDKTMTSYFAGIVDFIGGHPHYALTAIFLLALSEAIPVIGTVVPGSTLIIGICALATGAHVNSWPLLGAAIVGAIFGDGLSFWLGRRYQREILLRWPLNRYPQFIDRSEAFIKTYGGASVFLARFIAVVRAFVPLVAGILGMSSRQFYAVNILSALAWAPAHVFPGVLLGMALSLAGLSPGRLAILLIVGLIAVSAAGRALRSYLSRPPFPANLPDIAA